MVRSALWAFILVPAVVSGSSRTLGIPTVASGFSRALGRPDAAALYPDAQEVKVKGEKIYADQKCGLCHSIGAVGNKKGPLDEVGTKLSHDDIRAWIVDAKTMTAKTKAMRKPNMKTYVLPKDDLDDLVAYMASLKKK